MKHVNVYVKLNIWIFFIAKASVYISNILDNLNLQLFFFIVGMGWKKVSNPKFLPLF